MPLSVDFDTSRTGNLRTLAGLSARPLFVFFFQAEDGIRDADVTGVQTCALPISRETTQDGIPADPEGRRDPVLSRLPRALERVGVPKVPRKVDEHALSHGDR